MVKGFADLEEEGKAYPNCVLFRLYYTGFRIYIGLLKD